MDLLAVITMNVPLYIPIICFIVGLLLCLVETFTPGFGLFGTLGILCLIAGIVLRALSGGTFWELFITIVLLIAVIVVLICITAKSARSGRLSKSALVLSENAVPEDITTATRDYKYLIGREGVTTTFLRPVGKAKFGDETVEVVSEDSIIIDSNERIKVVSVEGQKVAVIKL